MRQKCQWSQGTTEEIRVEVALTLNIFAESVALEHTLCDLKRYRGKKKQKRDAIWDVRWSRNKSDFSYVHAILYKRELPWCCYVGVKKVLQEVNLWDGPTILCRKFTSAVGQ